MKYKKILTIIMVCLLAFCLIGCGDQNTEKAVANKLEKDYVKLEKVVTNLEELNYDDIIIDDLSPIESNSQNMSSVNRKSAIYSIGNISKQTTAPKHNTNNAKYVNSDKIGLLSQEQNYRAKRQAYTPKYVNETNNRDLLDDYLQNIENVFNCCSDCVNCNQDCKNEMSKLEQNIKTCKTLCSKLKDGTITLTENEKNQCYDCMDSLTNCISRLESTKGNITDKCKEILKLKNNFGSNLNGLQGAYQKLLNALENRLDCVKQCNENFDCIFDIINKSNVDMTDAEKNKSDQKDIENWNETEEQYTDNYSNNTQTQQISQTNNTLPINYEMPYNNGPYNYGYGYNGYGYPNQYAPYPPRNIDTYRYITKNIDTYGPNYAPNQNYQNQDVNTNNQNTQTQNRDVNNNQKIDNNQNQVKAKRYLQTKLNQDEQNPIIDNQTNNNLNTVLNDEEIRKNIKIPDFKNDAQNQVDDNLTNQEQNNSETQPNQNDSVEYDNLPKAQELQNSKIIKNGEKIQKNSIKNAKTSQKTAKNSQDVEKNNNKDYQNDKVEMVEKI